MLKPTLARPSITSAHGGSARYRLRLAGLIGTMGFSALEAGCYADHTKSLLPNHYSVTIDFEGSGEGHVSGPYSNQNRVALYCPGVCGVSYQEFESLTFTAIPIAPTTFGGWARPTTPIESTQTALTLNIDQDQTWIAYFDAQPTLASVTLSGSRPPNGGRTVFTITGSKFDPDRLRVTITGTGCETSPYVCKVSLADGVSDATSTTAKLIADMPGGDGRWLFTVKNGPEGNPSNGAFFIDGCPNPVVITDDFESSKNWSAETSAGAPAINSTVTLETTGGVNGGGFRKMVHQLAPNSSTLVYHWFPTTYTPSIQGAISSISYSEDRINLPPFPYAGSNIGSGFLVDGGASGRVAISIPPGSYTNQAWATATLDNLTQSNFGTILLNGSQPLRFGYFRSNGNSGSTSYTTTHGVDNFQVTLCR